MPVFSTLGSLYEFKEFSAKPPPIGGLTLTRVTPGYGLNANWTFQGALPPYYPITYIGRLNPGNTLVTSNTTTMDFTAPPFNTYNATIVANNIVGNSLGVTSSNVTMTGNLVSNGNIAIANASAITISPSGNEVDVGTLGGSLLRYSRNTSTGQLTLLSNTSIATGITSLSYSADGNFLYIFANSGSRIYSYNMNSNTFVQTGGNNVTSEGNIFASTNSPSMVVGFGYVSNPPFGSNYSVITYSRNTTTGNLTQSACVQVGTNFTSTFIWEPSYNGNGNAVVGVSDGNGNAQLSLYNIAANGTIAFQNRANLFLNQGSNNTNTIASVTLVSNTAYVNLGNSINAYSFANTLTNIGNTFIGIRGRPHSPMPLSYSANPLNTVIYYNGNITYQRNTNGTLTLRSNSASYTSGNATQLANGTAVTAVDTRHVYLLVGNTVSIYNVVT